MSYEPDKKLTSSDPRSRLHFIKYVTKDNETSKRWECGICGREFNRVGKPKNPPEKPAQKNPGFSIKKLL